MNTIIFKISVFAILLSLFGGTFNNRQIIPTTDKTYEQLWKEVDDFDAKGLPRSAFEVVEQIYVKAIAEKNNEQIIKSCIYRYKYIQTLEEDGQVKSILQLEKDIKQMPESATYFAHMLLAELYFNYYQYNYYVISQRSRLSDFTPDDLATWDESHFKDKIIKNYMLALNDALKSEKVQQYPALIHFSGEAYKTCPTVYDLFSRMAFNTLSRNTSYWYAYDSNSTQSIITDLDYCKPVSDFVKIERAPTDTIEADYFAFEVMRNWIGFRLQHPSDIEALVYADLMRLNHFKAKVKNTKIENTYLETLQLMSRMYAANQVMVQINYLIASHYMAQGSKYSYSDTTSYKYAAFNRKAYELLQEVIAAFPDTLISGNCYNSMYSLERRNASFSGLNHVAPGEVIQMQLAYRNIEKIKLTILQIDYDEYRKIEKKHYELESKLAGFFAKSKLVSSETIELGAETDLNEHARDILLKPLGKGHYIILAHLDNDANNEKEVLVYANLFVTDLAYVNRNNEEGAFEFYVVDRTTGKPVKGAAVSFFTEKYNYVTSSYVLNKEKQAFSDADGFVFYKPGRDSYSNYQIEIRKDNDIVVPQDYFYAYNYFTKREFRESVNLFTDRAIYRPGQTIHLKGIAVNTDGQTSNLLTRYATTVELRDPNYQVVGSLKVTTNLFGSFSGSFEIPTGLLTGSYQISCAGGSKYVRVEEYKRPNFEVKFKPIEEEYRLGDKVNVSAEVKTYSGSNLTGAKIQYTVTRMVSWRGWPYYYASIPAKEVLFGECETDENGRFTVSFIAETEYDIPSLENAYFQYSISARATDINGETQPGSAWVFASNKSLLLSCDITGNVNRNNIDTLRVSAINTNGKDMAVDVSVKLMEIEGPALLLQKNYFGRTDRKNYTIDEWYKQNPGVLYDDENNFSKLKKGKTLYKYSVNTGKNPAIAVADDMRKLNPGIYCIQLEANDKYGNSLSEVSYFTVYAPDNKKMPITTTDMFFAENSYVYPGETAVFYAGTSFTDVVMLYEVEHKGAIVSKQWVKLDNELRKFEIPVTEEHRGNFSVHLMFVKNGRFYTSSMVFFVPWDNKALSLKLETFRNKIEPGDTEEWRMKVVDNKGKPVSAEIMAGMYDASLDVFAPNGWYVNYYPSYYSYRYWSQGYFNKFASRAMLYKSQKYYSMPSHNIDFQWYGLVYYYSDYYGYYDDYLSLEEAESSPHTGGRRQAIMRKEAAAPMMDETVSSQTITGDGLFGATGMAVEDSKSDADAETRNGQSQPVNPRTNFSETAFFYPHLETDENGIAVIRFTAPESLTRWNLMALAHTADLKTGNLFENVTTSKDLMLMPNTPRFVRENDTLVFSAKISNVTEKAIDGKAEIRFFDAISMNDITSKLIIDKKSNKTFTVKEGGNCEISWVLHVPEGISGLVYRITAQSDNHSDGEEKYLPVMPNRMLVTETMPLPVRGMQTKKFNFNGLLNSSKSSTLKHHKLTLEFTSNPAWYAVQALPYLAEYPYECAEQVFSRYYANSLASYIANSDPKIKRVFDSWRNNPESNALKSNMQKNQDLKALLLEETPWVLQAQNETERKRRVALLFDMNQMQNQLRTTLTKLKKMQVHSGAWPWFEGMPEDRYITQHIVGGIGHLDHLGVVNIDNEKDLQQITQRAISYIDAQIVKDYEYLKKYYKDVDIEKLQPGYYQIHYLYVRSFFLQRYPVNQKTRTAFDYYLNQGEKYWLNNNRYMQGMLSLALYRNNKTNTAQAIVKSLKEHALQSEEMGMYWKSTYGFYWHEAPIETQALMIEVFHEVSNDSTAVEEMKIWLLKQKQTQDWKTTKATANAIYALLLRGTNLLAGDDMVEITMGDYKINNTDLKDLKPEAGTGYFAMSWSANDIKPNMGNITVRKAGKGIAWGAVYWQYFEQLDKITAFEDTPLKINKKLFVQQRKDGKQVITPLSDNARLKLGDRVIVRIEIRVDRDMQYVHLKDMRAACFEPESTMSGYRYRGGLGYYQSVRDVSVNFFMSYLNKGTYVFEYPLIVSQKGEFSNGITTMQCMYAPEFASHSQGIRVKVD